jgi:restriction system protein
MTQQIIIEGACPTCGTRFKFDDEDRRQEKVQCTRCKETFFIVNAAQPSYQNSRSARDFLYTKIDRVTTRKSYYFLGYVEHKGLGKSISIKGYDRGAVLQSMEESAQTFTRKWESLQQSEYKQIYSSHSSERIKKEILWVKNLLKDSIEKPIKINWNAFKKNGEFSEAPPTFDERIPQSYDAKPAPSFMELFSKEIKSRRQQLRDLDLQEKILGWEKRKALFKEKLKKYEEDKVAFHQEQENWNSRIDAERKQFIAGEKTALEKYIQILLVDSLYPEKFPENITVEFKEEEKILIVDYELPAKQALPQFKDAIVNKKTGNVENVPLTDKELNSLYDDVLFSMVIRTLNEVFSGDVSQVIEAIAFNGFVDVLNKATGHKEIRYLLSLIVKKEDFAKLNLEHIDPKECFFKFKGISAKELSSLTPIPPIMMLERNDKRFVEAKAVVDQMDSSINLAAINWEDFEHLVREVIEREFGTAGMEVKITQSSRDLGVDAVAFDSDPLRGGKIIIQAKRYTNTVKVESVRALYGIMQDEGAMKGIMVTTSDYGSDAYKFAQGKPISLINGNNLLSLLEKHGKKAIINLVDAKRILRES